MIIKTPEQADLQYLAQNLRKSDIDEIAASSGLSAFDCLCESVKNSAETKVVIWNGKPLFIYGVARLGNDGCVWLIGTDAIIDCPFAFVKICRSILAQLKQRYGRLYNFAYAKNKKALKWLNALGATIDSRTVKRGPKNDEFKFFVFK